jgi:putative ABC transport system permease protein
MLRTTLAGLRAHKLRLVATALAIVLGVGFVAGTLIFQDTAKAALFDEFARGARNVDVVVESSDPAKPLTSAALDTARGVSGVAEVEGRMSAQLPMLDKKGRLVANGGTPGLGVSTGTSAGLREYDVTAGRAPTRVDEAAIDDKTAEETKYAVGDTVTVLDPDQGKHRLKLVGTVNFGTAGTYRGMSVVVLPQPQLATLTGAREYTQLAVHAEAGANRAELRQTLAAALPGTRLISGEQRREELAAEAIGQVGRFVVMLQLFAFIAVLVSAFVIYNTFNILLAQRVREMALLRCVGASRGQLFGSVLLEALVVGVVGAGLGVGLGVGVAYGLFSGADLVGMEVPRHALVLTATPVLVAIVLGVVVTVVSALLPALRSTRVAPLAALRAVSTAAVGTIRGRVALIVLAVLAGAGGTALTLAGMGLKDKEDALVRVIGGGVLSFLAVLLLSPLIVGPLTAAVGWLPGRILGSPARLATANARRNPGRAAATTTALMIGVGLMSASAVLVSTTRATVDAELADTYQVDYFLQPTDLATPADTPDGSAATPVEKPTIPSKVADTLRADRAFSGVARVHSARAEFDGKADLPVGAVDPASERVVKIPAATGSTTGLKPGTVAMEKGQARSIGKKIGDRLAVTMENGRTATMTLVGTYDDTTSGFALFNWTDLQQLSPAKGDSMVMLRTADGVSAARSRAHLDTVLADAPLVRIRSLADWREQVTGEIDKIVGMIAALLGFAILIALVGIMNTLALSVFERTRESAMVRALGLTRAQLRGTLLVEAVLMAVVGAIVGISFGVLYGYIATGIMYRDNALVIDIPVGQLLGYVALAALAGAVAAVWPARRAAKASVVAALSG